MKRPRGGRATVALLASVCLFWPVDLVADERSKRVDALFNTWIEPDTPGCALGIIENGQFIYQRGYGAANLDYDIPITSQSVFRIGSVSKQFTAMAVLLAAEEGKLSLDDDIRKYLPELSPYDPPVTIRHLLHHTSGLRDYLYLMDLVGKREDDYYTNEEVMALLARLKELNFRPGEEYLYSNTNYFLFSQIIPRVTGKSLREWAAEKIFRPLGMNHTHFHDDLREVVPRRATGYRKKDDGTFEIDVSTINMVGDGGLFTTVEDLFKWDQDFYRNVLGGPNVMPQMLAPGTLNDGTVQSYALGLRVSRYRGLPVVGHGGSWVGYRAATLRFPEQKFSVICLCNRADAVPWETAARIADIYLADAFPRMDSAVTIALPEAQRREREGTYWNERTSTFATVKRTESGLSLTVEDIEYALGFLDEDRFVGAAEAASLTGVFEKNSEGYISMHVQLEGQRTFEYVQVQPWHPSRQELSAHSGTYENEELGVRYVIRLGNEGRLELEGPALDDPALEPAFPHAFRWAWGTMVFVRNNSGEISGFRLSAGSERNLVFVKRR